MNIVHYGSSPFIFSFSIGLAHCPTFCRWGSLIPQVAFADIGSANPRSLQAGAKIGQCLADHISEPYKYFLLPSDKCYLQFIIMDTTFLISFETSSTLKYEITCLALMVIPYSSCVHSERMLKNSLPDIMSYGCL